MIRSQSQLKLSTLWLDYSIFIINCLQLVLVVEYQLSHHCIYKNELCAILLFRFWLSTDLTCVIPYENIEETLLFFFIFSSSTSFTSRFLFQFSLDFHWIGIHNAYFIFFQFSDNWFVCLLFRHIYAWSNNQCYC